MNAVLKASANEIWRLRHHLLGYAALERLALLAPVRWLVRRLNRAVAREEPGWDWSENGDVTSQLEANFVVRLETQASPNRCRDSYLPLARKTGLLISHSNTPPVGMYYLNSSTHVYSITHPTLQEYHWRAG